MQDNQLIALMKKGKPARHRISTGLYFRVVSPMSAFWTFRYTFQGKRKEHTIAKYGVPPFGIKMTEAQKKIIDLKFEVEQGNDPQVEKRRPDRLEFDSVDQLAEDWLSIKKKRIKNPQIPERVYRKDIAPYIGNMAVCKVEPRDIAQIIRSINDDGRPSISNDALSYLNQLFNHAIKMGLVQYNPASAFDINDAGGEEKSRKRVLSINEITSLFQAIKSHNDIFVRENYLACCLLLLLGVRKGELIAAKWDEFDFEEKLWHIPEDRTKNSIPISIPIPLAIWDIFSELKVRAADSEYVFPKRRSSKRFGHVSPDTLNAALNKLLSQDSVDVEHFTVHDLRRTFRTLLASCHILPHIAERCLNHKLPKIEGTYDLHDYLEQRRDAYEKLSLKLIPHMLLAPNESP
ncbi:tyrosine-type recombinase/integrase [Vibrio sp. 10N.237.312.C02]|uniref:tyrosine-type recombinase/integrase n=1 Tax=unclassified Vibrio TaxID=2614977 RepID=UPI00352DAFE4